MDKCPVCSQVHTYERTWTGVDPPIKAALVSTHLTTCSKFLAMSPDARMAVVVDNCRLSGMCCLGPQCAPVPGWTYRQGSPVHRLRSKGRRVEAGTVNGSMQLVVPEGRIR